MSNGWGPVAHHFSTDAVAHLATLNKDGGPHVVPLWVDRLGESDLAFFTIAGSRKDRNVTRDPRVSISVTAPDNAYVMATMRGRVVERLEGEAAWPVVDQISRVYTGESYARDTPMVAFVIRPDHWWANDFSDE